ncbi:uncharacterized protein LOC133529089 [Cydia pomonella]|uniref:uncharacterized protein LOC133529089 n=1 Tax=Cydia pomonella TaxID=82600 RepID=UPI002ADDD42E|nr:uncharacterized protein LOC133529089 [Cydia pomonella]
MRWCACAVLLLQITWQCSSRAFPEENISVYTANTTTGQGDVYHQIANNIAERITSPIYRFLGIGTNKTEPTTKKPWINIESFDEPEDVAKTDLKPLGNGLEERDVEELSVEALKKNDKKPEKITLYSSYLPSKLETLDNKENDTINEVDDPFEFDDDDDDFATKPREGGFVYYLELLGSFFQLALGAVLAIFKSSSGSN